MAGTYPTSQAASRWASRWNPLSVELCPRPFFGLAWDCANTPKSITSHVYHEGVAQRAHNLSPVPFGAAKSDERTCAYHCSARASQIYGSGPIQLLEGGLTPRGFQHRLGQAGHRLMAPAVGRSR